MSMLVFILSKLNDIQRKGGLLYVREVYIYSVNHCPLFSPNTVLVPTTDTVVCPNL
jgi:hypothetical protein